jgi:hypothetical protein
MRRMKIRNNIFQAIGRAYCLEGIKFGGETGTYAPVGYHFPPLPRFLTTKGVRLKGNENGCHAEKKDSDIISGTTGAS